MTYPTICNEKFGIFMIVTEPYREVKPLPALCFPSVLWDFPAQNRSAVETFGQRTKLRVSVVPQVSTGRTNLLKKNQDPEPLQAQFLLLILIFHRRHLPWDLLFNSCLQKRKFQPLKHRIPGIGKCHCPFQAWWSIPSSEARDILHKLTSWDMGTSQANLAGL